MIEVELAKALRKKLEEILAEFRMPTDQPNFPDRAPKIINGYLPPKRTSADPDFPFVIVRPKSGRTPDESSSRVAVNLIIGCYSEEFDGHEYALNVMTRIRTGLLEMTHYTLDNRYRLEFPLSWELFDDQPYPQWQLEMTTEWTVATPQDMGDEYL